MQDGGSSGSEYSSERFIAHETKAQASGKPSRKMKAAAVALRVRAEAFGEGPVEDYRGLTGKFLSSNFADILNALGERTVNGSLSHMKVLFEIGGIKEEIERRGQCNDEPTLGDLIVTEIRRGWSGELSDADQSVGDLTDGQDESSLDGGARAQWSTAR